MPHSTLETKMCPTKEQFIRWVDELPESNIPEQIDFPAICDFLDLDMHDFHSLESIRQSIDYDSLIRGLLAHSDYLDLSDLEALKKDLILSHFLDHTPISPYLEILESILSSLTNSSPSKKPPDNCFISEHDVDRVSSPANLLRKLKSCPSAWLSAISLTKDKLRLQPSGYILPEHLDICFNREFEVASSADHFKKAGINISITNGAIDVDRQSELDLARQIEQCVQEIGGMSLCRRLTNPHYGYPHLYSATDYLATLGKFTLEHRLPLVPVGYLLNLSVKHLDESPPMDPPLESLLTVLFNESARFASLYDIQPYHGAHVLSYSKYGFLKKLEDIYRFDRIFRVSDHPPYNLHYIINSLFGWVDTDEVRPHISWSSSDLTSITKLIISSFSKNDGPYEIPPDFFYSKLSSIEPIVITEILRFLSHDSSTVNSKYLLPDDFIPSTADFIFKPLIRLANGNYCYINAALSSRSFYEAAATQLRSCLPATVDINDKIGKALEHLVRTSISNKGYHVHHGIYNPSSSQGEIDAVIETNSCIILIECKKKALVQESRFGSTLNILKDFEKSIIHGFSQLSRHVIALRESDTLKLKPPGQKNKHYLHLSGRKIIRLFLNLTDFGSLHSPSLLEDLLYHIMTTGIAARYEFTSPDSDELDQDKYTAFRQAQDQLTKLGHSPKDRPFYDCFFLNLDQFLFLLEQTESAEILASCLHAMKSVNCGARDFYTEFAALKTHMKLKH